MVVYYGCHGSCSCALSVVKFFAGDLIGYHVLFLVYLYYKQLSDMVAMYSNLLLFVYMGFQLFLCFVVVVLDCIGCIDWVHLGILFVDFFCAFLLVYPLHVHFGPASDQCLYLARVNWGLCCFWMLFLTYCCLLLLVRVGLPLFKLHGWVFGGAFLS